MLICLLRTSAVYRLSTKTMPQSSFSINQQYDDDDDGDDDDDDDDYYYYYANVHLDAKELFHSQPAIN